MKSEKRIYPYTVTLLLFCLGSVLLFLPVLFRGTFAADDYQVIRRVGADRNMLPPGFFRPLSDITLYGNFVFGGFRPLGYYLFNILLHGVNSFLVFLLCFRWKWTEKQTEQRAYAYIAGLLFLFYPFHSEAVNWVIGRGASLSTCFGLGALVILSGERSIGFRQLWVAIFYFIGMAAYEPALFLPLVCLLVLYNRRVGRKEMVRWVMVFGVTLLLHLVLRIVVSGGITGEYGHDFLDSGWSKYAGNAVKVAGRLFLPPSGDVQRMQILFFFVLAGLTVCLVVFYKRTRGAEHIRHYLFALLLMVAITCILPVVTAVSTRTSESDRLLYFPSVFLCCALSLLLVVLIGNNLRRKAAVLLLLGYMFFFLQKGNLNWSRASLITRDILNVACHQPAGGKLFVINLPDEKDGAFIFRLGFPDALLMAGKDTAGLVVVNHLTRKQWLETPDSILVARTGGELYIDPAVTIRPWAKDSLQIEGTYLPEGYDPSQAGQEKSRHYWLAGAADRILYWNKKSLVELVR